MRWLNIFLCLLMLLFIGVQFNDPDGPMWMLIYAVPMLWAGFAAFRPVALSRKLPGLLLLACIAAALAAMVHYWPKTPGWWKSEVWWEVETAREGMGMMIVALVLAVAWLTAFLSTGRSRGQQQDPATL